MGQFSDLKMRESCSSCARQLCEMMNSCFFANAFLSHSGVRLLIRVFFLISLYLHALTQSLIFYDAGGAFCQITNTALNLLVYQRRQKSSWDLRGA